MSMDNKKFEYVYGYNIESEYPLVNVSIERITPDVARKMLEANVGNRDKKKEPLTYAIKNGEWKLNGETVAFSWDGVLRDGQNRLMAIIEAGIPVDTVVVRGVDPESQITMDSGTKRTLSDFLKMAGYKNYKQVATIGAALCRVDETGLNSAYYKNHDYSDYTTTRYLKYIEDNYETRIAPIVLTAYSTAKRFTCLRLGTFAPILDAFYKADVESAIDFAEQMRGEKEQCQPVQKLVQRLNDAGKNKQITIAQSTIAAWTIKAWNAYMQDDELRVLQYRQGGSSKEQFPQVYGLNGEL